MRSTNTEHLILLLFVIAALAVSAIDPFDRHTWWLEVMPVLLGAPLLIFTYRKFPLTNLVYRLLFLHALGLIIGGHYTYARVPVGFWAEDWFGFTRNHYDRLGHFVQGFVPAILAREILLRKTTLLKGAWLFFLVVSVCLAFSACYELIECAAALIEGSAADEFLGMQGDVWDTQADMFFALLGAVSALILLSRWHDREMEWTGCGS